ncbi:MAG: hypothetical protein M3347_18275, partial [Armatimonadota bacterium]|nr:hypothetical protein [Armatimonadota bacterium]
MNSAGFLAGPVLHLLDPDFVFGGLLFPVVSLAVAIILFEGGLSLRLFELPHVGNVLSKLLTLSALWLSMAWPPRPSPIGWALPGHVRVDSWWPGRIPGRAITRPLQSNGFPVLLVDTDETNIEAARRDGLPVYHARRSQLAGLFAVHEIFGRAEVYQLPPKVQGHARHETVGQHHRGRLLFGAEMTDVRLFAIDDKGNLQVFTTDRVPRPQPGHTLISLV